jgi:hypothetical protein
MVVANTNTQQALPVRQESKVRLGCMTNKSWGGPFNCQEIFLLGFIITLRETISATTRTVSDAYAVKRHKRDSPSNRAVESRTGITYDNIK